MDIPPYPSIDEKHSGFVFKPPEGFVSIQKVDNTMFRYPKPFTLHYNGPGMLRQCYDWDSIPQPYRTKAAMLDAAREPGLGGIRLSQLEGVGVIYNHPKMRTELYLIQI